MIAVIDYGVGNLFSLTHSLRKIGADVAVTSDPDAIKKADRLVLPGVGAFKDAADKLKKSGLDELIKEQAAGGKPLLGICLGMQMLFDKSYEYGEHRGLGLIHGSVKLIDVDKSVYKIPHIGWNALKFKKESPLFKYIHQGDFVYFVHSYHGTDCGDSLIAVTDYGVEVTAAVMKDNVFGTQFHPEKSGEAGLNILRGFCEYEVEK